MIWMKRTEDGFAGTHPLTGQHFRVVDRGDTVRIALDGRHLRTLPEDDDWLGFINALTTSELDRQDEVRAQKTSAEHATDIAEAINKIWLYRMTRPTTDSAEQIIGGLLDIYGNVEATKLALPMLTDRMGTQIVSRWLAERREEQGG